MDQKALLGFMAWCLAHLSGAVSLETEPVSSDLLVQTTNLLGLCHSYPVAAAAMGPGKETTNSFRVASAPVFLDVRSQHLFRLAHVPGAMNLPLFAIKGKAFLRTKELVLLNQGHSNRELLQEAERIQSLGFRSVRVLNGGMRAWQV